MLEAVDALSVAITAHALETNSTFPFVNLPNAAYRFGNARVLSALSIYWYIEYLPLVTDETRAGWEAFVKEHRGQYLDAYQTEQAIREHQDVEFGRDDESDQRTETTNDHFGRCRTSKRRSWDLEHWPDGIGLVALPPISSRQQCALANVLGHDTSDLDLRIGLYSGPGAKSRIPSITLGKPESSGSRPALYVDDFYGRKVISIFLFKLVTLLGSHFGLAYQA